MVKSFFTFTPKNLQRLDQGIKICLDFFCWGGSNGTESLNSTCQAGSQQSRNLTCFYSHHRAMESNHTLSPHHEKLFDLWKIIIIKNINISRWPPMWWNINIVISISLSLVSISIWGQERNRMEISPGPGHLNGENSVRSEPSMSWVSVGRGTKGVWITL